jgi:hypothetical protein
MEKDIGGEPSMYGRRVTSSQPVRSDLAERGFIRDLDPVGIRIGRADRSRTGGPRTVVERIGRWPALADITESEED